jgi:hypothetical protein
VDDGDGRTHGGEEVAVKVRAPVRQDPCSPAPPGPSTSIEDDGTGRCIADFLGGSGRQDPRLRERSPAPEGRSRLTRPFIRGPLDLEWVRKAGALPGRALLVGLHLHYLAGLARSLTVRINLSAMASNVVHRATLSRALKNLERAGLVTVRRRSGACAEVTLVGTARPFSRRQGPG